MEVAIVKYERLVNLGNFNNEKISVEAAVGNTDGPDQVLLALQFLVAHSVVKRGLHDPQSELAVERARAVLAGEYEDDTSPDVRLWATLLVEAHEEQVARQEAAKAAREADEREAKAAWERDASVAFRAEKADEEGYIPF